MQHVPQAEYIQKALATVLSKSQKAALSKYSYFGGEEEEEEEKDGLFWKIEGAADKITGYAGTLANVENKIQEGFNEYIGVDIEGNIEKVDLGKISEIGNIVADTQSIISNTLNIIDKTISTIEDKKLLDDIYLKAEKHREKDDEKAYEAAKSQTEAQKARAEIAIKDNRFITGEVAKNLTSSTKNSDLVNSFGEYLKEMVDIDLIKDNIPGLSEDGVSDDIIEIIDAAKDTILFIMQFVKEKKMIKDYYNDKGPFGEAVRDMREKCTSEKFNDKQLTNINKLDNIDLAEKAYGFEGFDEHSSFVGMRIVHSIISSASHQNSMVESRMKAMAIMYVMGMKKDIGKLDSETHEKLYNKFMGGDYR